MRNTVHRGKSVDKSIWTYGEYKRKYDDVTENYTYFIQEEPNVNVYIVVDKDSIGESTGFKDKYNKTIFEGDIIRHDNGARAIVRWNDEIAGFDLLYTNIKKNNLSNPILVKSNSSTWIVESNTYDNPSLQIG